MFCSSCSLAPIVLLVTVAGCGAGHGSRAATTDPASTPGQGVTAKDIENNPSISIEQLLMARVPGLSITRAPDGQYIYHLRGSSTLYGDQQPLFVLNGIPLDPAATGTALSSINPHEVESVQVLRDAINTSMYGARGANGVIVIRTKRT
jgi:TonB-dependent starch-binding outer membrane protein SusC